MPTGVVVLLTALALVAALGLWRGARDGRFSSRATTTAVPPARAETPAADPVADLLADVGATLGERATLLQFSSAFCAPCRATRQTLGEAARLVDGVRHVEVDAEHHLGAVRSLGVLRTPTTLILDATGREASRAMGAPRKEQVLAALASVGSSSGLTMRKGGSHSETSGRSGHAGDLESSS